MKRVIVRPEATSEGFRTDEAEDATNLPGAFVEVQHAVALIAREKCLGRFL